MELDLAKTLSVRILRTSVWSGKMDQAVKRVFQGRPGESD